MCVFQVFCIFKYTQEDVIIWKSGSTRIVHGNRPTALGRRCTSVVKRAFWHPFHDFLGYWNSIIAPSRLLLSVLPMDKSDATLNANHLFFQPIPPPPSRRRPSPRNGHRRRPSSRCAAPTRRRSGGRRAPSRVPRRSRRARRRWPPPRATPPGRPPPSRTTWTTCESRWSRRRRSRPGSRAPRDPCGRPIPSTGRCRSTPERRFPSRRV